MAIAEQGLIAAVVGPSGVGKDSVMEGLVAADPKYVLARRVITRPTEAGGEAFDGVSQAEFDRRAEAGAFVLSWRAHGLSYGVPRQIEDALAAGRIVLVNLSRSVLRTAQASFPNLRVISLTAPPEVLAQRLAARGREAPDDQARRLLRGALPLPDGLNCVHVIDNSGSLDRTIAAVRACLQSESV